jgi:hypothetical protein
LSITGGVVEDNLRCNPAKKIASARNELANHLQFVLSRISTRRDNDLKKDLKNVLLFLHREDDEDLSISVEPKDFTLISVKCPGSIDSVNNSWFFEIDAGSVC